MHKNKIHNTFQIYLKKRKHVLLDAYVDICHFSAANLFTSLKILSNQHTSLNTLESLIDKTSFLEAV